jgi:hypothetical protein
MRETERRYLKGVDAMLDRWEKETKAGTDNPGKVSDPKPGWDHKKYLKQLYSNPRNYR